MREQAYENIRIKRTGEKLISQVMACFRYSFLNKITEIGGENNIEIIHNSKAVKWIADSYNILTNRIVNYASSSIIMNSTVGVKKELHSLPVKAGGIVVFTAVLSNSFLSLVLHKEVGPWGWIIRVAFLCVAFWGIFCEVSWEELIKTSWLIRNTQTHIRKG